MDAVQIPKKINIPVVLSREEVPSVIGVMQGVCCVIVQFFMAQ